MARLDYVSTTRVSCQHNCCRYHYYLQRDTTLGGSVTCLQPPWQAGIVQKVLDGLKRADVGGGGGDSGGCGRRNLGGRGNNTGDGTSDSSYSAESGPDDAENVVGYKPGGRTGRSAAGTESTAAGDGAQVDPEEDEEDGDKFEVNDPPGSPGLAGSTMRLRRELEPERASERGRGDAVVVVGGEAAASLPASLTPTPTRTRVPVAKRREAQGAALGGGGRREVAAMGMSEIPDRYKEEVKARLCETCDAFETSIRRAVLNYVLLDPGQRDRLGRRHP